MENIKFSKSLFILLISVFVFALFLRFYKLDSVPVGFHRDEAFFGYNAYSLLQTGNDMSGNFLPIHLQSFLYSPAGYSYFSIPSIALFGLNEFAVRFASALFGSLTVVLTYFLAKELFSGFKTSELRHKKNHLTIQPSNDTVSDSHSSYVLHLASYVPLVAAALLAISPWHINLSRTSTENILVVFFIGLGLLLYLRWVNRQSLWLLIASFLSFGLTTILLYQAPRAFLPLFLPVLFLLFNPKPYKKNILLSLGLFFITIIIPIFFVLTSHDLSQRMRMLSIFQHLETKLVLTEQIREDGETGSVFLTRFFHNKAINYSETFLYNYFQHFTYQFLFTDEGFPDRYRVPGMGLLYIFELPLILLGIWKLIALRNRVSILLLSWIVLAPLGTAFTFNDVPNLQRTLLVFPALSFIGAIGFVELWLFISNIRFGSVIKVCFIVIVFYSFFYYMHQYYVHQIYHRPWFRQEGYKQLVTRVDALLSQYKQVVITDSESAPSIFFLFYKKYNPMLIQNAMTQSEGNYGLVGFEKYVFVHEECPLRPIKKQTVTGEKDILYVNHINCKDEHPNIKKVDEIKRSDNSVVFYLNELK